MHIAFTTIAHCHSQRLLRIADMTRMLASCSVSYRSYVTTAYFEHDASLGTPCTYCATHDSRTCREQYDYVSLALSVRSDNMPLLIGSCDCHVTRAGHARELVNSVARIHHRLHAVTTSDNH